MTTDSKGPGVAQTTSFFLDNSPTWVDLYWFVDKARESGIEPGESVFIEYDENDPSVALALQFFTHPDTSTAVKAAE